MPSRNAADGFGVTRLTPATTAKPPSIAKAPQLIGLTGLPRSMLMSVRPTPHAKQAHTAIFVTPRQ